MKKVAYLLLAAAMIFSIALTGCGNQTASVPSDPADSSQISDPEPTANIPEVEETHDEPVEESPAVVEYPISDGSTTLSVYAAVPVFVLNVLEDSNIVNSPAIQSLTEATGVNMEFHGYQAMNASAEYGLMFASQDYPDLFANAVDYYNGGAEGLIENDVIIDLNEYLPDYAPDYLSALEATPSIKKAITTSSGYIGVFAGWADPSCIYTGLIIRQDWLDELSLDVPKTYDQLENVLEAFKVSYGCKDPLYMVSYCGGTFADNGLVKGYGTAGMIGSRAEQHPFYQKDGNVYCGLLDGAYRDYLEMMAQWYANGYISSDFISYTSPSMDESVVVRDECGVFFSSNDKFETCYGLAEDENFKLSALRDVTVNEGDTLHLSQDLYAPTTISNAWSISTQCANPELAASYMNYLYIEEGIVFSNYGTEGVAFEYVDGEPVLKDLVLKNPDNSVFTMQYIYTTANFLPTLIDQHKSDSAMEETAIAAYDIWAEDIDAEYTIINDLLPEDSESYSALWGDISAFAQEKALAYITGGASFDNYEAEFVDVLIDMGINKLTEYRQNAVDAFNMR